MEDKKDILKWLNREASDKEFLHLKETKGFKTLEKIAYYSSQLEVPKINIEENLADLKLHTRNTFKKRKVVPLTFKQLYKYAAVILVLFTTCYYLVFNNTSSFKTEFAQTKSFKLPDNSEVLLNANSKISYVIKDWKKSRSLTLNGEAYFKVQKGNKFTVNTAIGKVTVLGTEFNIKERENYFEVKTFEGLVCITYKDTLVKLPKGSVFKVVNGIVGTNNTFDVNKKSWLQKESNFKSTALCFVLEEIENQFDCTIESKDIDLEVLYSGGFTHSDLNIALQSVTIPLHLKYKIKGKKITLLKYDK